VLSGGTPPATGARLATAETAPDAREASLVRRENVTNRWSMRRGILIEGGLRTKLKRRFNRRRGVASSSGTLCELEAKNHEAAGPRWAGARCTSPAGRWQCDRKNGRTPCRF